MNDTPSVVAENDKDVQDLEERRGDGEEVHGGNPGDVKPVGRGVSEMRIDYGPGYRLYFVQRDKTLIVLLCGGGKASQKKDVGKALDLAEELKR